MKIAHGRKRNIKDYAVTAAFCAFLIAFLVAFFVVPDREFSETEKRSLSLLPSATVKKVFSGDFSDDFEKYVQDQIPLRNLFVGIGSYFDAYTGRNGVDGIYHGSDGYLFNEPVKFSEKKLNANLEKLCGFVRQTGLESYMMIVPSAGYIMDEKLPAVHMKYEDDRIIKYAFEKTSDQFEFVELCKSFKSEKAEKQIFYKTDHHWTSEGAYIAYCEFCVRAGKTPIAEDLFKKETVNGFCGTTYSKAALWGKTPDNMELWSLDDGSFDVKISDLGSEDVTESSELFFREHLTKYDMYPVYLNGNHSLTVITNDNVENGALLILKDSYANTLATLLANNYHRVVMVDMRYYRTADVSELIAEHGIDSLLVNYGIDNIINDTNLTWLR